MNNPRYAAINTKLRAMEARFLDASDYKKLLQAQSIKEIATYLKSTDAYSDLLDDIDMDTVNRSSLEHVLKSSMINDVDSIIKYFSGNYKKFIHALYAKYEIADMKQLARRLFNKVPPSLLNYYNIDPAFTFIGKYSGIAPEKVYEATEISEIIETYEGTAFYKYLKPILLSENKNNLFRFETELDLAYYNILLKESTGLEPEDKTLIKNSVGTIADLLNLQWIYRGINFYHFMPAVLFNYTISAGNRFSKAKLRDLAYLQDVPSFVEKIKESKYGFLIKDDQTNETYMERRLERYVYFFLRKMRLEHPMSIIQTFSHIIFLEYQMRDIITLIEVNKYHLSTEEAQGYLIKYIAERT